MIGGDEIHRADKKPRDPDNRRKLVVGIAQAGENENRQRPQDHDVERRLQEAYGDLERAQAQWDTGAMATALNAIGDTIKQGSADYVAWEEIGRLLDQRRRLVESERKRQVEMHQMITAERAMILLAAVVQVIKEHVRDRDVLAAISTDIRALVAAGPGGPAE